MNTQSLLARTIITFTVLTVAGVGVVTGAQWVSQPYVQSMLIAIGSAIFGAGLTFFLIRMFSLGEV
jgi:hypothetical protein